jgi:ribosomal 30S subunit maturation factor RimM
VELHDVEGYSVLFADGRRLGRVAWIEYGSRSDQPDSLVVRRRRYQRPLLVRVAVEIVATVDRRDHVVALDVAYDPRHFFLRQPL